MSALSPDALSRSRKIQSLILERLASVGQGKLAEALEIHESEISRWKSKDIERCAGALAVLGLKVVPVQMRCFDPVRIGAILQLAKAHLSEIEQPEQLAWEDDQ